MLRPVESKDTRPIAADLSLHSSRLKGHEEAATIQELDQAHDAVGLA